MHIKTAITVVLTLFLSLSNISNAQGLDWGQDIRWTASLENAKKNKTKASRKVIVKVDLRKSPFRKVEKVVTKIAFFDVKGIKIGEEEFSLGDGRLQPGKLHVKLFPNPHTNATSIKGIELRATINGETYVDRPLRDDSKKIARS